MKQQWDWTKRLSQTMDYPLPTNNTHIIMTTNLAHTQI